MLCYYQNTDCRQFILNYGLLDRQECLAWHTINLGPERHIKFYLLQSILYIFFRANNSDSRKKPMGYCSNDIYLNCILALSEAQEPLYKEKE